ncbi:cytochrome-c peroxidase [Cupriavidus consociatus]|uniref:cytochrome-c peroxidase n=1 Tax=Cupriavidus consociatus TaxID=2821357 RepID=UPI001AE5E549|nr:MULTISPECIES: cytochrome c peroxidase [unclassified Cupriavidus]MBP0624096.1 cytochrome-c peroxidase [Cupriavidus sp. LEh25]MDK2660805.1 cytochrome c peroxidase [Cupriavidus sp. LEh21]
MTEQHTTRERAAPRTLPRKHLLLAVAFAVAALAATAGSLRDTWQGLENADRWTDDERAVLGSMRHDANAAAPADPSNRVARSPQAAGLGERLFHDTRFSRNGAVSCASCHDPARQFQDGIPLGTGIGIGKGQRRTMPVVDIAANPFFFWDGRADSLWAQALGPMENPLEHGETRLHAAHVIQRHYRAEYEALFGPMPDLAGLPPHGSPNGTADERAAWQALRPRSQEAVSRVFANMGKAIAAYEASLRYGNSRVDTYIRGVVERRPDLLYALDRHEKAGLRLFIGKAQCATCHSGPLLSDHHFHNTGIAPLDPGNPDRGRAAAIAPVMADEFNCLGRFSDARPEQCEELRFIAQDDPRMLGAFKTPTLRNVAQRAPYMHAGQLVTLEDVIRHYSAAPRAAVGHSELKPLALTQAEQAQLQSLLRALSGPVQTAADTP